MKIGRIIIFLVLVILIFWGTKQIRIYIALQNSDIIVRIAYRGLENLFRAPQKYYAVSS